MNFGKSTYLKSMVWIKVAWKNRIWNIFREINFEKCFTLLDSRNFWSKMRINVQKFTFNSWLTKISWNQNHIYLRITVHSDIISRFFFKFFALPHRKLWYFTVTIFLQKLCEINFLFANWSFCKLISRNIFFHAALWIHENYRFSVKSKFIFASNWNKKSYLSTKAPKLSSYIKIKLSIQA